MKGPLDVICFGEILWDLFEVDRARARRRQPIARTFRRELGGAPANVATGLARLGVRSAIAGAVGCDRFGDALLADLEDDGVDVRFVQKLAQRTGLTFVVRDARGEPEYLFYRHDSADLAIRANHLTPAMGRARWVVVGTSMSMTPALARATARFLAFAKKAGARIFLDLNVRAHLWSDRAAMHRAIEALAGKAAVVKASVDDLRAVAGPKGGQRWLARFAPRATWLLTRGGDPASAIGVHGQVDVPALRTRCVDATGAGDAFIAGALATIVAAAAVPGARAWEDRRLWRAALHAGHAMGRKVVSRPGAVAALVDLGRIRTGINAVRRIVA